MSAQANPCFAPLSRLGVLTEPAATVSVTHNPHSTTRFGPTFGPLPPHPCGPHLVPTRPFGAGRPPRPLCGDLRTVAPNHPHHPAPPHATPPVSQPLPHPFCGV